MNIHEGKGELETKLSIKLFCHYLMQHHNGKTLNTGSFILIYKHYLSLQFGSGVKKCKSIFIVLENCRNVP